MRKHNRKFAQRCTRTKGDRSNFPQQMTHAFVKGKQNLLACNGLLLGLLYRAIGFAKPGTTRKGNI